MILLANSVHPDAAARRITPLRSKVATIAAAAVGIAAQGVTLTGYNETLTGAGVAPRSRSRNGATRTGLDVLAAQKFQPLRRQAHRPHHQPDRRRPRRAAATWT